MTDGGALYRMEVENVDVVTERETDRQTDRQTGRHRRRLKPRARYVGRALNLLKILAHTSWVTTEHT